METKTNLRQAYIRFVLEHGHRPVSIYKMAQDAGITEAEFYALYNSFEALEKDIWSSFMEETLLRLNAEEVYAGYTIREKLLSFYFTWIEVLKANRSFILIVRPTRIKGLSSPGTLADFRKMYLSFVRELIAEGQETGEIMQRVFLSDRYAEGLWLQVLFVLDFWIKDDSQGFEKTDAAIEKAVNLSFDFMGRNTLDSGLDFIKFLFQNRKEEA
jgi:AcrR family transcriptional regulator